MPATASMSSVYITADNCIDGNEGGSLCITLYEAAPWLALDYGSEVKVSSVVLINRITSDPDRAARARNVNIRVSSTPPASGSKMFTGGQLLGTFKGPGTSGQRIEVTGGTQLTGRYVVVQMDFSSGADVINLLEVTAWCQGRNIKNFGLLA